MEKSLSFPEFSMLNAGQGTVRTYSTVLAELSRVMDGLWIILCFWYPCHLFDIPWDREHLILAILAVGIFTLGASFNRIYRSWRTTSLFSEIAGIWVSWMIAVLFVVFIIFIYNPMILSSNSVFLYWFTITAMVFALSRTVLRLVLRTLRVLGLNRRPAAIVGATETGQQMAENLMRAAWMGIDLLGVFDARKPAGNRSLVTKPFPINGSLDDLAALAEKGLVERVYIALPLRAEQRIKSLVDRLKNTTVTIYFIPDFSTFDLLRASWDYIGGLPVVSLVDTPFRGVDGMVKRMEDIVLASLILMIIAIPMLIIATLIKLSSKGPVIYRQTRYGLDYGSFAIWKFRTLKTCDDDQSFSQVKADDPRLTPLGAFLRRTSLDELPQFFNVLQGSMSIVGPRPHNFPLDEKHRKLVHRYMLRYKIRPGITGWAQINGYRGETNTLEKMKKRIELDLEYIHNWSLWFDLKIIFQTLWKGFRTENAY